MRAPRASGPRVPEPARMRPFARPTLLGGANGFVMDEWIDPWLAAIPIVLVAFALLRWHWSHRHGRFFTVVEGHIYRSRALRPDRLQRKVKKHGIRAVIDLRSARPAVEAERKALAAIGVAHFHLPSKQVPRPETVEAVLALIDQPENRPALVHCNHGVRRAAQFDAICRMEYLRWPNQRAVSLLRRRSGFLGFGPRSRSRRFLDTYVPRWNRGATLP